MEGRADFEGSYSVDTDFLRKLEQRLGPIHARQRLGIETDHEAQVFGQGLTFFHLENLSSAPAIIRNALKLTGLYWRARRNADRIVVRRNELRFAALPSLFDGYTILHISDMHVELSEAAMQHLIELVDGMQYDLCVLTGDYRGKTFGPFEAALEGVARVRAHLRSPIYGVLGNHDTIQMVPAMEAMGIPMLLNECEVIARGDQRIQRFRRIDVEIDIEKRCFLVVDHRTSLSRLPNDVGCANPEGRVFDSVVPYAGNLSSGCPRQFQSDAERPHARWPALSSRGHSDQAGGGVATTNGSGSLAVPQHERLHFCGCRIKRRSRAPELSAGNHPALPSARLTTSNGTHHCRICGSRPLQPVSARFDCHSIQQSAFGQSECFGARHQFDS